MRLTVGEKEFDNMFSHFDTDYECHRRTDERTDRQTEGRTQGQNFRKIYRSCMCDSNRLNDSSNN